MRCGSSVQPQHQHSERADSASSTALRVMARLCARVVVHRTRATGEVTDAYVPGSRVLFLRVTLAVVATAALSSCSSAHHPATHTSSLTTSSSTITSATPTPSPSRTGPLLTGPGVLPGEKPPQLGPLEAPHDVGGALSFAIFYYRAYDWSVATNDPYLLSVVSSPTCTACARIITRINDLVRSRETLRGGRISLVRAGVSTERFSIHADEAVRVRINQDAYTVESTDKTQADTGRAETIDSLVFVSWVGSGWRVEAVTAG